MREQRLLERISSRGEEQAKAGASEQEIALNSVLVYLRRVLNTRQGSVPIALDFGVPDYHSIANRFSTDPTESVEVIEGGILEAIRKWEPRLSAVKARLLDKKEFDITMTLEIEALLHTESAAVPVIIRAVITSEGRIDVFG